MRVLVACEYTGTVRDAFLKRGHDAWSCDLLKSPLDKGPHLQCNVLELDLASYDLVIGHPPCTYLTCARSSYPEPQTTQAAQFFLSLLYCGASRVVIENPLNVIQRYGGPPATQYVHPYHFGDDYMKRTGLWLINLPKLKPTKVVKPTRRMVPSYTIPSKGIVGIPGMYDNAGSAKGHLRSVFSRGMAEAMADQWGSLPKIEARWPRVQRNIWHIEALA